MELTRYMVLNNKGQDITTICNYNQNTGYYDVTYHSGKTYNYKRSSLKILSDPQIISIASKIIFVHGRICPDVDSLFLFTNGTEKYWRVFLKNGKEYVMTCPHNKGFETDITYCQNSCPSFLELTKTGEAMRIKCKDAPEFG